MKKILKLFVCVIAMATLFPSVSLARTNSWKVRPFIGYETSLASYSKIEYDINFTKSVYKEKKLFNKLFDGNIVLGAEFYNLVAVSISPNLIEGEETNYFGNVEKYRKNEIYANVDFYLASRKSNIKPFISLKTGYLKLRRSGLVSNYGDIMMYANTSEEYSYRIFGLGLGCKYYVNDNVYIGGDVAYTKTIEAYPFRLSKTSLNISAGYRF